MWKIVEAKKFQEQFRKLPTSIQKKFLRQLERLKTDFRYPSLHTKKEERFDVWEARIDLHYRFTFEINGDTMELLTIGMHDVGLGKK